MACPFDLDQSACANCPDCCHGCSDAPTENPTFGTPDGWCDKCRVDVDAVAPVSCGACPNESQCEGCLALTITAILKQTRWMPRPQRIPFVERVKSLVEAKLAAVPF